MHLVGVYDAILEEHMPPSLLVDENRALVQSFGGASRYLRLRDGRLSTDLLDMVDTDLRMALAGALQRACKDAAPIVYKGLRVQLADGQRLVNLTVKPVRNRRSSRLYALVSIEERSEAVPPRRHRDRLPPGLRRTTPRAGDRTPLHQGEPAGDDRGIGDQQRRTSSDERGTRGFQRGAPEHQ